MISPATGPQQRVLDAVRRAPGGMTLDQLTDAVRLSPSTLRFHLTRLIARHAVEAVPRPRAGRGRPPMAYRALAPQRADDDAGYRALADLLIEQLATQPRHGDDFERAGQAWARHLTQRPGQDQDSPPSPFDRLLDVLHRTGFQPRPDPTRTSIELHHCPFADLAQTRPEVCTVHLGLLHGALQELGEPRTIRLAPTTEGSRPCVVVLEDVVQGLTP
jgi:predicted ArsR family transcriptional regulator